MGVAHSQARKQQEQQSTGGGGSRLVYFLWRGLRGEQPGCSSCGETGWVRARSGPGDPGVAVRVQEPRLGAGRVHTVGFQGWSGGARWAKQGRSHTWWERAAFVEGWLGRALFRVRVRIPRVKRRTQASVSLVACRDRCHSGSPCMNPECDP